MNRAVRLNIEESQKGNYATCYKIISEFALYKNKMP